MKITAEGQNRTFGEAKFAVINRNPGTGLPDKRVWFSQTREGAEAARRQLDADKFPNEPVIYFVSAA